MAATAQVQTATNATLGWARCSGRTLKVRHCLGISICPQHSQQLRLQTYVQASARSQKVGLRYLMH